MSWLSDLFLGLAWLAIVLIPAIIASRQPVVSHNGYVKTYMDPLVNETAEAPSSGSSPAQA
jgi:hypothetical protein